MLGVRPEHIALAHERGVRATVESVEYLGGDSLVDVPHRRAARSRCARRAASASSRGDPTLARLGAPARSIISMPTARARRWRGRETAGNDVRLTSHRSRGGGHHAVRTHPTLACAALAAALVASAAFAQAPVEVSFFYPVAVGGPITKIIDGYAADFEKENPGHQGEADLFGQLPGVDHQGAHRGQERRAAGDVDPAVDRHVHADRRGRDRAVRRSRQDAGGPGVAQELLSGVHGEQPDRRQDLGHSVPALDDRPLLQQGDVQGGGARSEQAAGELEGDGRVRAEAHQARRVGQGDAMGRADSVVGLPVLAVPGARDRERRQPDERRRHARPTTTSPR